MVPDTLTLEQQYHSLHSERERVMLLLQVLPEMVEGYHPEATTWLDLALQGTQQSHMLPEHAEVLKLKGVHALYQARTLQGYQHMLEALQYARDFVLTLLEAELYRWLGNICTGMGHFHEAMTWFEEGLAHTSRHHLTLHHLRIQANLCWLYRHNNEPAQTVDYARQVIEYARQHDLQSELAFVHANVLEARVELYEQSGAVEHLDEADQALSDFRQVLKQNSGERLLRFELYLLSKLALARKQLTEAESSIQTLLSRLGEHCTDTLYGDAHLDLSVVRTAQGRWEEALQHLLISRQTFETASAQYGVMLTLKQEAEMLEQQRDFEAALGAFKRYHQAFELQEKQRAREKSQMLSIRLQMDTIHQELLHLRDMSQQLEAQNAALHQKTHTLSQEAQVDTLTGLPNRRAFNERFARMILELQQQEGTLGMVVIDIDHFKQVNDRFSHETGDQVLSAVGQLLEQHCRGQDFVARWGGEEFVVLLPGLDSRPCHQVCERLRQAIEGHIWSDLTPDMPITISLGFAVGQACGELENLFKEADRQLYQAKREGRNTVRPLPS